MTADHLFSLLRARDRLPVRLDEWVDARVRRLLRHAGATVPWYVELFRKACVDPERAGPEVLERLPVTRKSDWRARPLQHFHSTRVDVSGCRRIPTTGTSGPPVPMPFTFGDRMARRAGTQRCFWAAGVGVRDRYTWVARGDRDPTTGRVVAGKSLHQRIVFPMLLLDVMTPPDEYWERVKAWSPRGLLGCPLEVESIATWVADGRLSRLSKPVVCALYGEPVGADTRAPIETTLGPVREMYGSTEGGTIAWDCGAGHGLHVNADCVIVEFLREGRRVPPGTPGEVVITNLWSRAMPVIRYGQGDLGWEVPGPCPCGRPGPLMRVEPRFRVPPWRLPSGRRIGARFFMQALSSAPWLRGWHAEQPAPDRLRLILKVAEPVAPAEIRGIAENITRGCWEPVRVEVECRLEEESR